MLVHKIFVISYDELQQGGGCHLEFLLKIMFSDSERYQVEIILHPKITTDHS